MRKSETRMRERLDTNVRCECGRQAMHQVQFEQARASGERLVGWLPLCEQCYAWMAADEGEKVVVASSAPVVVPMTV